MREVTKAADCDSDKHFFLCSPCDSILHSWVDEVGEVFLHHRRSQVFLQVGEVEGMASDDSYTDRDKVWVFAQMCWPSFLIHLNMFLHLFLFFENKPLLL